MSSFGGFSRDAGLPSTSAAVRCRGQTDILNLLQGVLAGPAAAFQRSAHLRHR